MTTLLNLAVHGCTALFPTDTSWPVETRPWYALKDGMHRLKGEAMKTVIMMGKANQYLLGPMTAI